MGSTNNIVPPLLWISKLNCILHNVQLHLHVHCFSTQLQCFCSYRQVYAEEKRVKFISVSARYTFSTIIIPKSHCSKYLYRTHFPRTVRQSSKQHRGHLLHAYDSLSTSVTYINAHDSVLEQLFLTLSKLFLIFAEKYLPVLFVAV